MFDAVIAADNTDWRHARYLLNLGYDREGQPSVPHAQPIGDDQMIVSFNALPERIASGEILSATDAQLATLATAMHLQVPALGTAGWQLSSSAVAAN